MIELEDEEGHLVELRESFALSNVKEPLLALGKLLTRGWKIEGEEGDVRLTHGLFSKSLQFRHNNSLVVDAKTRKVGTVVDQPVEENSESSDNGVTRFAEVIAGRSWFAPHR